MIDSTFWGRPRKKVKVVDITEKAKALITGDEECQATLPKH